MLRYIWLLLIIVLPSHTATLYPRSAIIDCLISANVPQYLPGTNNFSEAINPFNLRLPFTPIAVAVPSTFAHVQAAVSCGVSLGITISAKSGGHSYASHGLGGENGHLMINMVLFNNVTVEPTTNIATIGPGARLGNVALALYNQGGRAISHGTCPGVGLGGHVLHGGYGFSSRTYGLALDNMISATVVLANSTIVNASATENSDLFWALRGAGSSYGIVTAFQFQTFAAPTSNTVFQYTASFSQSQARNAFAVLQNYANTTMSAQMNLRWYVNNYASSISGVYYGSQADFQTEIQPLLTQLGISGGTISTNNWLETLTAYSNAALATPLDYDVHETFFSKSLMTTDTNGVSGNAMDAFVAYWFNTATNVQRAWYFIMDLHGGPTSAITKVDKTATSYAHRNALLKWEFYDAVFSGSYPSDGFSFLNNWVATIINTMSNGTFGMYINYADPTLTTDQAHNWYWLDHYARLSALKAAWDPKQAFSNPQAVAPSSLSNETIGSTSAFINSTSSASASLSTSSKSSSSSSSNTVTVTTTVITSTTSTTTAISSTTSTASGPSQTHWGQCGGMGWTGPTICVSPYTCQYSNPWYSQCL